MIRIRIIQRHDGCLHYLQADGHASRNGAFSLDCGIVSALLRSFGLWAGDQDGLHVAGRAGQKGEFALVVDTPEGDLAMVLRGASQFLLRGLLDLQAASPEEIQITLENSEEKYNGT